MKHDPFKLRTVDLWSYTAPALQEMLQSFGLSTKGRNKDDLVDRINRHIFQSKFDPPKPKAVTASKKATIQIVGDCITLLFADGRCDSIPLAGKNPLGRLQNALFGIDMSINFWQGPIIEPTRPAPSGRRPTTLDDIA